MIKERIDHPDRHVAIGSRPELDVHEISKDMFDKMGESFAREVVSQEIQERVETYAELINKWRANKGQPGFTSVKSLEARALDNAWITTAVVRNEDGSEIVNAVVMHHFQNRVVVIAVSARMNSNDDLRWVVSTASKFVGQLR